MALYKRSETVRDFNGVVVSKVSVKVVTGDHYSETAPLASLFQDAAGLIPLANPLTADAAGKYFYWAAGGTYSEKISRPGYYSVTNDGFLVGAEKGDPGPQGNDGSQGGIGPQGDPGPDIRPLLSDTILAANGSGMMGFNYALAYAAGTIGKWLKDLAGSSGATFIGYLAPFTGAVARTQYQKNQDFITLKDAGCLGDGSTDDSAAVAISMASGAKVIDGGGLTYKVSGVGGFTVPAGVVVQNAKFVNATPPTASTVKIIQVNTGSKLKNVEIVGTGTVGQYPRFEVGISPAADGVTDVELDVKISNLTLGAWITYVGTTTLAADGINWTSDALLPKRWRGRVVVTGIVGQTGLSEGYGVLSQGMNCDLDVYATDCNRHAVYLSSGAKFNNINITADGRQDTPVHLNTFENQAATRGNVITGRIAPTSIPVGATNTGAVIIEGKSSWNRVSCTIDGLNTHAWAVEINANTTAGNKGASGNIITGSTIRGQFTGDSVIRDVGGDGTQIHGNNIAAYAVNAVINTTDVGTPTRQSGPQIYGNRIDCLGQAIPGVLAQVTAVNTYIGPNAILNNAAASRVTDNTSGKRTGWSREVQGQTILNAVAGTSVGATTITFPQAIDNPRVSVTPSNFSVSGLFSSPSWAKAVTTTGCDLVVYNGNVGAQNITLDWCIRGD